MVCGVGVYRWIVGLGYFLVTFAYKGSVWMVYATSLEQPEGLLLAFEGLLSVLINGV